LLIGVLDKIGLIPLGVAAYFSLIKLRMDQQLPPAELSNIYWISSGIIPIYLMVGTYLGALNNLINSVVLKHAVQAKKKANPSPILSNRSKQRKILITASLKNQAFTRLEFPNRSQEL